MRVRFHQAARAEVLDAGLWYQERSPLTAAAFVQEDIYYRTGANEIVIVAFAHQKRRPGYWASR